MKLEKGNKYIYTNIVKVGMTCKRTKKHQIVVYIGAEGTKEVFQTESGSEVLLNNIDIIKFIKEF